METTIENAESKNAEFRERVRVRLAVLGMSQTELCYKNAIRPQNICSWLKNFPHIKLSTLYRIAEMLNVSPSWLLDGDIRDAY